MGKQLVLLIALCGSAACDGVYGEPTLFVGPGEVALVDYSVNGDIGCEGGTVIVESTGSVNGSIDAKDRIELRPTSKVVGDIRTMRARIAEGSLLTGNLTVLGTAGEANS